MDSCCNHGYLIELSFVQLNAEGFIIRNMWSRLSSFVFRVVSDVRTKQKATIVFQTKLSTSMEWSWYDLKSLEFHQIKLGFSGKKKIILYTYDITLSIWETWLSKTFVSSNFLTTCFFISGQYKTRIHQLRFVFSSPKV